MEQKSRLTTLCYIENEGAYLMLHRISKKNDVNKDKWIGVGGHFEGDESPEDCLLREVREDSLSHPGSSGGWSHSSRRAGIQSTCVCILRTNMRGK